MISIYDYIILIRSIGFIEGAVSFASEDVKTAVICELDIIEPILRKIEEELAKHED